MSSLDEKALEAATDEAWRKSVGTRRDATRATAAAIVTAYLAALPRPDETEGVPVKDEAVAWRWMDRMSVEAGSKAWIVGAHDPRAAFSADADMVIQPLYLGSAQTTKCACCGEVKPTPLRRDDMGGYVCLSCVEARLDLLSVHPAPPAQDGLRKALPEAFITENSIGASKNYWIEVKVHSLDALHAWSDAIQRLSHPQQASSAGGAAVPDGWKLVPVEPTREMWAGAATAICDLQARGIGHHDRLAEATYRAMLATAPSSPSTNPHEIRSAALEEAAKVADSIAEAERTHWQGAGRDAEAKSHYLWSMQTAEACAKAIRLLSPQKPHTDGARE